MVMFSLWSNVDIKVLYFALISYLVFMKKNIQIYVIGLSDVYTWSFTFYYIIITLKSLLIHHRWIQYINFCVIETLNNAL